MHRGVTYALLAAALFGVTTPLAKGLLGEVHPIVLAGLLYAGSGAGLAIVHGLRVTVIHAEPIAWPSRQEWSWLAAAICFGGVLGPVLLMFGLATWAGYGAARCSLRERVYAGRLITISRAKLRPATRF
jgi:drug/metabolite transporter (DMT)-like permease